MADPAKLYEGSPCGRCGNRLRWKCDRRCVHCKRIKNRKKRNARFQGSSFADILFRERRRAVDRRYNLRKLGVDI